MFKYLLRNIGLAAFAVTLTAGLAIGVTTLPQPIPITGPGLIPGSTINTMITALTELQAGTGTPAITANSITAGDSSLDILGLAAAQGGVVIVTGGTSSTTGNAGGAARLHGGLPGATGIGGDATVRGAIGGATSGAGGLASVTGGAGTAGNAAGGLARAVGGAGQGSAAGGAAQLTGGAGGATGAGGAVTLTGGAAGATSGTGGAVAVVGGASPLSGNGGAVTLTGGAATTSGTGGDITVTAGASTGGTNNGASVNLVPTAAVSTGIPGTVQINGNAALSCPTYYFTGTPAATDQVFFVATRSYFVVSASEVHSAAAGGASALQVVKDTGTDAPGAGTDLLTNNTNTGFDLAATANTVQVGTLTATVATKTLAAGNRLSVDFANAIQSSAGVVVTVCLAPI